MFPSDLALSVMRIRSLHVNSAALQLGLVGVMLLGPSFGCAGARAIDSTPSSPADASSTTPSLGATRYQVGDYVLYRYSGAFTPSPVTLRERIMKQEGNRLTIDVVVERGGEQRRWRQVVTDTPENEKNNVVDELYEIVDGAPRKLTNANNEDVFRLYAWTVFIPEQKARDVRVSRARASFGGQSFDCERTEGRNVWRGRPIRFEAFDCPDFVWTHGPARFWDEQNGTDVSRVEVVEFGREPR